MKIKTNENGRYLILNLLLILIILIISIYMYLIIESYKGETVTAYEQTNEITTKIEAETKNTSNVKTTEENVTFPIIEENNTLVSSPEISLKNVKNNRYFYNQLNQTAKIIYDTIEQNLDNMKSGTYKITLPKSVSEVLKMDNGEEQLNEAFQSAWDAISLDRVDMFFIDISKINLIIKKTTYLRNVSYDLEIQPIDNGTYLEDGLTNEGMVNNRLLEIVTVKNDILSNLEGTTYDKVLKIHDWIIENLEYSMQTDNVNSYDIYGAMVKKTSVCEGYAETLKYLLDEIDIPCVIVSGTATNSEGRTENHAWNYVQIDGKWYGIDCTWDDPVIEGWGYISNSTKHKYFLKGAEVMEKDHIANGKVSGNGQMFEYPKLQKENYK